MRILSCLLLLAAPLGAAELKFEVKVKEGLLAKPTDGRVIVVMQMQGSGGRVRGSGLIGTIGDTGLTAPPIIGKDALQFASGKTVTLDKDCPIFPVESLAKLPKGKYTVQAVFHHNYELNLPTAPGNLVSEPATADIDPATGGTVSIELSRALAEPELKDTESIKYIKLKSEALSKFHGRDMYLRAGVCLPDGYAKEPDRKWPLRVHIGGYGTRFTGIRQFTPASAGPFIVLHLDGAGPYGDNYQVDSANNGPYGEALTKELIPHVEKLYRGVGQGHARFTDGASTGGWVSLALQLFYPDYFNGCWSFAPDSTDFRSYELMNLGRDTNAYVNRYGFERPAKRDLFGDCVYTVRHECQSENVMGRGDNWSRSGKDWCAWNATYGPRGKDGFPVPLWDPKTGQIDNGVLDHWKKYDLRRVFEEGWSKHHADWQGKIHIYVGDADDYFLNNGVRHFKAAADKVKPAFEGTIMFGPYAGHGYHPISGDAMRKEMLERFGKGRK